MCTVHLVSACRISRKLQELPVISLIHLSCLLLFLGTWKGGREKAPAAFCRKAIGSTTSFEVWGDGEQTRSFMFVDDCVEGVLRIMMSDFPKPLNLGTEEMVSLLAHSVSMPVRWESKERPTPFLLLIIIGIHE